MMIFTIFLVNVKKSNNVDVGNDERVEKKKTQTMPFALESFFRVFFFRQKAFGNIMEKGIFVLFLHTDI